MDTGAREVELGQVVDSRGDCVRRSLLAEETTSVGQRETLIYDIINKITCLEVDSLTQDKILHYIKVLGLAGRHKALPLSELRSVLAKAVKEILQDRVPHQQEELCLYHRLDSQLFSPMSLTPATSTPAQKTANDASPVKKMAMAVQQVFGGRSTSATSFVDAFDGSVEKIVELLDRLDEEFPRGNLKQLEMNLTGRFEEETHRDRSLRRIKEELVRRLIMKMEVDQMRQLLAAYPDIKLDRNNDRVPARLKAEALKSDRILDEIVAVVTPKQRIFDQLKDKPGRHAEHWLGVLKTNSFTKQELRQLYRWHFQQELDSRQKESRHVSALMKKILMDLIEPIPLSHVKHIIRFSKHQVRTNNSEVPSQLVSLCMKDQVDMRVIYDWKQTSDYLCQMATPEKDPSRTEVARENLDTDVEQMSESLQRNLSVTERANMTPDVTMEEQLEEQSGPGDPLEAVFQQLDLLQSIQNTEDPALKQLHQDLVGKKVPHKNRWKAQIREVLVDQLLNRLDINQTRSILQDLPGVKVHQHSHRLSGQLRVEALRNDAAIAKIRKCLLNPKQLSVSSSKDGNIEESWIQQYIALIDKVG